MLDILKASLLDLHHEVTPHSIRLILGGGYGLYLKQHHLQSQSIQTMLDMEIWPEARATNDLDVFLSAEVVTDSTSMGIFRASSENLGYREIESAKYYQFIKPIGASQHVKLDLLAGPLGKYEDCVKGDPRRVRPRPSVSLHARRVDEALGIEESCTEIDLAGYLSSGATYYSDTNHLNTSTVLGIESVQLKRTHRVQMFGVGLVSGNGIRAAAF